MAQVVWSNRNDVDASSVQDKIQAKFDLSIALTLSTWTALTFAVQNSLGGPQSIEKRDWFAGAISELLEATPDADAEYLEEFLLQVMDDEFEVNVEDGSAEEVAARILELRKLTLKEDFALVDEMMAKWEEKQKNGSNKVRLNFAGGDEAEESVSGDDSMDGSDHDVDMDEAPEPVEAPARKLQPEVDEDGFSKVVGRRKRWPVRDP